MGLFKNRGNDRELIPIGWALTFALGAMVGLVGGLLWLAWSLLGAPAFTREQVKLSSYLDLVKIVLAVVAGTGGVVALVVAYRRQRTGERAEQRERTRLLNERFDLAANKLGSDQPAVRLAGVHALANLADDWDDHEARQMCIDVLCSYLRMAENPEPTPTTEAAAGDTAGEEAQAADGTTAVAELSRTDRETRHTILRVIAAHLRKDGTAVSWTGHNFDLRGITIDLDLDLAGAKFPTDSLLNLDNAQFSGGGVSFDGVGFSGGAVSFSGAGFSGGRASFIGTEFSGAAVSFSRAEFSGGRIWFGGAEFSGGAVSFGRAEFSGGRIMFDAAEFSGAAVSFTGAEFSGAAVSFGGTEFSGDIVDADGAAFSDAAVEVGGAEFSGGEVDFGGAGFSGGRIMFGKAQFLGGLVDLSKSIMHQRPEGLPDSAPGLLLPPTSDDPDGGNGGR